MARKYFGTDGIRGQANTDPMTADVMLRVARAVGTYFRNGKKRHTAIIGKDTRLSGYLLEPALTAGFIATGMDVVLLGPLPTPGVAMLTRTLRADVGVMISASHNPYLDNGIKLFGPDGLKLSDKVEAEIESIMDDDPQSQRTAPENLGRARRLDDAVGRYIEFVKHSFPKGMRLDGLKIVVDCAHGAAYKAAPAILWELGADVIPIGVDPDGLNINKECGATHTEALQSQVVLHQADVGVALDGDADRLIMVDEKGQVIDGDQVLSVIASSWKRQGLLKNNGVAATVMSNLGMEKYLQSLGISLSRTAVGDRYVIQEMLDKGFNVGGEQSGHVILTDYSHTGDAMIAALQVLAVLVQSGKSASETLNVFKPFPQVLKNVRYDGNNPLEKGAVKKEIEDMIKSMSGKGRVLVRKSGTESLIRIMVESDDEKQMQSAANYLEKIIKQAV